MRVVFGRPAYTHVALYVAPVCGSGMWLRMWLRMCSSAVPPTHRPHVFYGEALYVCMFFGHTNTTCVPHVAPYVAPVCGSVCGSAHVLRAIRLPAYPHVFYGGALYVCVCVLRAHENHMWFR